MPGLVCRAQYALLLGSSQHVAAPAWDRVPAGFCTPDRNELGLCYQGCQPRGNFRRLGLATLEGELHTPIHGCWLVCVVRRMAGCPGRRLNERGTNLTMAIVSMKLLLEAGVHFGH